MKLKNLLKWKRIKRWLSTGLILTLITGGAIALNNTFNDDKLELSRVTVLDIEKEKNNLITPKHNYAEAQTGITMYQDDTSVSFFDLGDTIVVLNGLEEFTEDFILNNSHYAYIFTTREIAYLEVENSQQYGTTLHPDSTFSKLVYGTDFNLGTSPTLDLIMPEECWTNFIDSDCTAREMKTFIEDELFVYSVSLNYMGDMKDKEDVDTSEDKILEQIKIYYRVDRD